MRNYFFHEFRTNSSKLVRKAANIKLHPGKATSNPDDLSVQKPMTAIEGHIYASLNTNLGKQDFVAGSKMSVLDILYFCEIY